MVACPAKSRKGLVRAPSVCAFRGCIPKERARRVSRAKVLAFGKITQINGTLLRVADKVAGNFLVVIFLSEDWRTH